MKEPCVHGVAKSQTRLSNFTFTFHNTDVVDCLHGWHRSLAPFEIKVIPFGPKTYHKSHCETICCGIRLLGKQKLLSGRTFQGLSYDLPGTEDKGKISLWTRLIFRFFNHTRHKTPLPQFGTILKVHTSFRSHCRVSWILLWDCRAPQLVPLPNPVFLSLLP